MTSCIYKLVDFSLNLFVKCLVLFGYYLNLDLVEDTPTKK